MRRECRWVLMLLLGGFMATGAAGAELDLQRAVELALARNPGLKAVEERRSEVQGGITEARADALPQVDLTSAWSRSRNPSLLNSPDFDEFLENFPGGTFEPREQELSSIAVEVTQPIWTFGKVGAALDLARTVADAAEMQIDAAQLDVALEAAEAYYGVLAARQALRTVEEQQASRRESLGVVEARYEIGEATRLELLQSKSQLSELLPELASAEGRLRRAEAALRTVLSLPPEDELDIVEPARQASFAPVPELPVLVDVALARRPELEDLELQEMILGDQQRVVQADGRPQVEFTGLYGREAREVQDLGERLFDNWAVAVGMRWEFFDGGRRRGELQQLQSQQRQVEWQRRDLARRIRLDLEQIRTEYETARARLRAAEIAADAAREARRVAQETYREGVALQADLLDAQQRETQAEIVLVDASYDTRIQAARLARALGYLPTEDWRSPVTAVAEVGR